jgi:histidinol-phosphate/aromatic aminotransferase/cobyric acid decarboxylase-like protein
VIPAAGAHGGDGPAVARALGLDPAAVLDLSATLNPHAPNVVTLAARHLGALRHYPDAGAATRLLAEAMGVTPERLVLTNGGSEAIALVAGALGGPHNPTGLLAAPGERADVWDEAFHPLATGRWTAGRPGVVVGSLTKVFACPGLRLGYVLADDAARLTRAQPHWSVGSLALAVLPDLLERADLSAWAAAVAAGRQRLAAVLAGHGLAPAPSDAPWVLVRAPGLRDRLAPLGVVVRDCASFGLPGHARIAVPDEAGLARLDAALAHLDPEHPS